ncbi:anti-sigma regulatory factor (Ser/Thr protein kinase) [Streptomyces sp. SAI-133]|uniref:ATP-binding protein n=1 Tax=Streptomyces sp. SAI-133 TaxID=2940547 RepID=UPI002473E979|nr:ATP-binding protein [Streptomyces sp. SAI-133]MDH6581474.1 anti-sigma regulatory factor (Ser/Thr protein kinase) [Streptomyces sp. SAI-133]
MSTLTSPAAVPIPAVGTDRGGIPVPHLRRGALRVTLQASARPESVGYLRRRASMILAGWMLSTDEAQSAELVISELLTNAVEHGRADMTLAVARTASDLEITVIDHGHAAKSATINDPDEHGRGLAIVAALTHNLSIDRTADGWHTLARIVLGSPMPAPAA